MDRPDQPLPPGVTLRAIVPDDRAFLTRLYASTREEELAPVPWPREQKDAFLLMQFHAQHTHYQQHYANASFDLILQNETPIGRFYVSRTPDDVRIIDISLIPESRGQGIGSTLLHRLQSEARATGATVSIHVERMNPALRLYDRLGFRLREDRGIYLFLDWRAEETVPT